MSEETGFSFYSGMLSVGSCIGYLLTGMDNLTSEVDRVPVQYHNVYCGSFLLVVVGFKEYFFYIKCHISKE